MKTQRSRHAARSSRLQPIREALDAASLSDAEALLREYAGPHDEPERLLLEARLRHLRDDAPAIVGLLSGRKFTDRALEAQRVLLLAIAHTRLGEFDVADDYFDSAQTLARELRDGDLQSEIAYRRGRRYIMAGDASAAREQLAVARHTRSLERELDALHLESFILHYEGRHREQAQALAVLLNRIDPADPHFTMTAAYATHTLAALAREMDLPDVLPAIERHLHACIWPDELAIQRFQSFKALGWSHALRGDYFNAFRYLKYAANSAPTRAWYTMAMLDRAYLARCLSEQRWSHQELGEAEEVAESVDWRGTRNEERVALLLLAEMFSQIDSAKAARYMAEYRDLGELNAPLMHFTRDSALTALADYSAGVTQLALGNHSAGVKLLRESLELYEKEHYDWRAGRSALRLFQATHDEAYLRLAAEKLRNYPESWLAEELRALSRERTTPKLPPMQQRVFEELRRGLSTAEIAKNLERSEFTIKNHIKQVFKAYGVKSRAALLAKTSHLT
jgi:DNA-binding NarL/FixJ family response regulator